MHFLVDGNRQELINKIKNSYLQHQNKYELLCSEVMCCARQVKIWLAVSEAKEKFGTLKGESFWGWLQQYSSLRVIVLDAVKIMQHGREYLASVIKNLLSPDQYKKLMKSSCLQKHLDMVDDIARPLEDFRNKRVAHLENTEIAVVKINLQELYVVLTRLDSSLNYISHYLLNPRYILDEEWYMYRMTDSSGNFSKSTLDEYFENDYVLRDCEEILRILNGCRGK